MCLLGEWMALWQPEGVGTIIRHLLPMSSEIEEPKRPGRVWFPPRASWEEGDACFIFSGFCFLCLMWKVGETGRRPTDLTTVLPREVRSCRSGMAAPGQSSKESEKGAVAAVSPSQVPHMKGTGNSSGAPAPR